MDSLKDSFFTTPRYIENQWLSPQVAVSILVVFALIICFTANAWILYDPAFEIGTFSRALYVDEGFYSDAAQNFVKFGQWGLTYDSRHWPGAPLLTVIQSLTFSVFGVSLSVARMISVVFALISMFSLYAIARARLSSGVSLLLTMIAVTGFSFTVHARFAIADPIATGFSLLAMAAYVRVNNRYWAIGLSVCFAYMAICSKMYFLFALVTIVFVWIMELIVLPLIEKRKINLRLIVMLIVCLGIAALSYLALRIRYDDAFAQFLHINSNKTPSLNPLDLIVKFYKSLYVLPYNTKSTIAMQCIGLILLYWFIRLLFIRTFSSLKQKLSEWGREGWVLSIFLVLGLFTTAALNLPNKTHYHFYSILPILCLSVFAIDAVMPRRLKAIACVVFLLGHMLFQVKYYDRWLSHPEHLLLHNANVDMVNIIEAQSNAEIIPVIGQYSAQLALYSEQMVSLEVKWLPTDGLCQRLDYWRPDYFVNFLFPQRVISEGDQLAKCESLKGFVELARYKVNKVWNDELILYQLVYH